MALTSKTKLIVAVIRPQKYLQTLTSDVKTLDDPKKGQIQLKYDPYFIKKATKILLQNFKRATPKKGSAHYKSIKSIYSLLIQSTIPSISDTITPVIAI